MAAWQLIFLATLSVLAKDLLAQAPGDEAPICNRGNTGFVYTPSWVVLMDSFNYQFLLEGTPSTPATWRREDFDGTGSGFHHGFGGACRSGARVCDWRGGQQNNWFFTQYISYLAAYEVIIQVDYQLTECNSRRQTGCTIQHVDLYRFDANAYNAASQTDPNNYVHLKTLQQTSGRPQVDKTRFIKPPGYNGFYIAIKDNGTCGTIKRIQAYYEVCHGSLIHLLEYPVVSLPPRDSPIPNTGTAECVANAESTSSLEVYSYSDGTCNFNVDTACQCVGGYEEDPPGNSLEPKTCNACEPGYYRSSNDVVCRTCPEAHTIKTVAAATQCPCESGAFRTDQEGPESPCSVPPTACQSLEVRKGDPGNTTLCAEWERPLVIGRDDFYYVVEISVPAVFNGFRHVGNVVNPAPTVEYCIDDLRPNTEYNVRISVANGVSHFDSANNFLRTTTKTRKTCEGVPSPPSGIEALCLVVIWKPPLQPNGAITQYEIEFSSPQQVTLTEFEPPDSNYILVPSGYDRVRIRAHTAVGPGEWTHIKPIGCPPTPEPVSCPPTPEPVSCPPTPEPVSCPPTPEPVSCPPTPEPVSCPPTPEPVSCPPTPEPVSCPPTPEPVSCPPTPEPVSCPPTPEPVVCQIDCPIVVCPVEDCPEPPPPGVVQPTVPLTPPPTPTPSSCADYGYQQCSFEYCSRSRGRPCYIQEAGCDGRCQVSHCRACLTEEYDPTGDNCGTCDLGDIQCLRSWGTCVRQASGFKFGTVSSFFCSAHPC